MVPPSTRCARHTRTCIQGDAGDYQAAVEQLSASQMKPVAMQRWLQALKLSVSHLTEEFDLLVGATLVSVRPSERGRGEELALYFASLPLFPPSLLLARDSHGMTKILMLSSSTWTTLLTSYQHTPTT